MSKFKFFEKNNCLTEYEWAFDSDFLQNLFQENYKHKYSLTGNGIYNLVIIDNKIYSIDLKKTTAMLTDDGKKAFRDTTKDLIIEKIVNKLKENNINCTVNSGKFITFKHFDYIFKIEVVKKTSMPN